MAEGRSRRHALSVRGRLHPSIWSQTMNIVGQLAETVFVTVKELYRGLNPATLTGGIDVIVVRQPDGSFQCSPFHVRFGKLGVLRSKEKIVDIEINGESVDLHMKLGDNGEAFFVEENENMEVPAHLCTSPIPLEVPEELDEPTEGTPAAGSGTRRKKRRRKRMRSDTHLREEASSSSDEREREKECERETEQAQQESPAPEDVAALFHISKSVYYSMSEEPAEEVGATQTRDTHPHSEGEQSPSENNVFYSRPSSPKSDSELVVKAQGSFGPQMEWNWGGFPVLCQPEKTSLDLPDTPSSGRSHFRTIERQDSFDMDFDPVISCGRVGSVTVVRPQPRTRSLDLENYPMQDSPTPFLKGENCHIADCSSSDIFKSCVSSPNADSTQTVESTLGKEENRDLSFNSVTNGNDSLSTHKSPVSVQHVNSVTDTVTVERKNSVVNVTKHSNAQKHPVKESEDGTAPETNPSSIELSNSHHQGVSSEQRQQGSNSNGPISEGDSGIDPCAEGGEENGVPAATDGSPGGSITELTALKAEVRDAGVTLTGAEGLSNSSDSPSKAEQQDKKKGKRNHHLGPTDIYLDDLTKLDPEVAALYFPKSDAEGALQQGAEQGSFSGSQSPQSVGSRAMDSGTEYLSDSTSYNMDVSMSLCGQEGDTSQITKEKFMEHLVTYQDFVNNPGIIEDPSLVICINSNYYNWAVAAPMVLSMTTFQKNLPKSTIERLVKDKMPKKSGRWWFSWRRRDLDNSQKHSKEEQEEPLASVSSTVKATLDDMDSDEVAGLGRKAIIPSSLSTETLNAAQSISQMYRKSLRLTSKQIEHLNLRDGANKVVFSVTTQYQGTCRCEAAIYLWNWDDRVIISDIDGTITKSDALGHILPQFGKDWTHKGIAKLYHKIHQNGYKFLYCSARAIGMAAITKEYLQWVNDKGTVLPKGPVLLAPSSLFSALHREVIEKKPEVFKIACLSDIRDLFNPQRRPFYAAFGNRTNDAYAYKQVGVSDTRIFTVNPKGELIREKTKVNKSSYSHLSELVEHFFPVLSADGSSSLALDCPDYSSFSYWKEPLPELDLDALL
ncbi:zgc:123305 isoform X2 [Mugil cephalus]|uniref:zgc:123305 isoform X2 n=1 Tax=Mugil cephalus TaxID=48193 RepID=UPI001FB5B1DF|nr:zgc:123305 isoform X2 [Mugil cephalus]